MFNQLLLLFLNYARYKRGAVYETIACYQLEIAVDMIGEAVSFADIIQDGIEDNQEFFIKINLLFPVDRMGINRAVFADDGTRGGYGL